MILFCPLQQAEQYAAFTACEFILALRQTVSAPLLLPGFHCNYNSESSWEILSSLGSISQINVYSQKKKKNPFRSPMKKQKLRGMSLCFTY